MAIVCGLVLSAGQSFGKNAKDENSALPLADRLAWQIALDRAGFSPGIIDGKCEDRTELATREYQRSRNLPVTGKCDAATADELEIDSARALKTYTVEQADLQAVGPLPKKWKAKADLDCLPYPSLDEALAEKFHCSRALLAELNGGRDIAALKVGEAITVPAVDADPPIAHGDRIEVNLADKIVRVFADAKLVGMFHCSIAKDKENLPSGSAHVAVIVENPKYMFDPKKWPEVKDVHEKLLIPPGPRNPVGLCWIGLSLEGYGIHGSPAPELIGKTGSHGCIRLTNWNAQRLSKMVKVGTPVTFANKPSGK